MNTLILSLIFVTIADVAYGGTPDPRIRKRLLQGYDPLAHPYPYMTTVTIPYLSVIHYDIDDQQQTFEVHAWIVMTWRDERLRWFNLSLHDPNGYLHFSKNEIWTPEITTYNTAKPTVMNDFADDAQLLVQSNGTVMWVPPVRFITNCKMNLLQWPFDTQRCYIKIGSWTFSENELDLQFDKDKDSPHIKVMSYEGHSFPNNTQDNTGFISSKNSEEIFLLCRKICRYYILFYAWKKIVYIYVHTRPPLICIVSLTSFLIPLTGNSRISLIGINFLVISAYMIYFRMRLPTIDHVPAIVRFFTWNLFITTFNLVLTVTMINLTAKKENTKIPDWAKILLNSKFVSYFTFGEKVEPARRGSIAKVRPYSRKSVSDGDIEEVQDNKPRKGNWIALVDLFDKACFTLFTIISFIMAIALLV